MGDLATLLPGAGALGAFAAVLIVLLRHVGDVRKLLSEADQRYRDEVKDHEETQRKLDGEREARRMQENQVAQHTRQIGHLQASLDRLTGGDQ